MKIRLAKAAIADLREAKAYIAFDDPRAAANVVVRIKKAIALIGERPEIGRPVQDKATREWSMPGLPYLIPYRTAGDTIEIIRVWHTNRQRPEHW